jgi:hypothetical protein
MESIIHFVFELLKISILGYVYSKLLMIILKQIDKNNTNKTIVEVCKSKSKVWFCISVFLFFYMFTPIGNHGLGDCSKIPISFTKSLINIDCTEDTRLNGVNDKNGDDIEMKKFLIKGKIISGNYNNYYFTYNFEDKTLNEFYKETEFNKNAEIQNLPKSNELLSFQDNYGNYWNTWRFWFLP